MTDHSKHRWVVFGVIWLGVLGLTYWNMARIGNLKVGHQQDALVQLDQKFWRMHSDEISETLQAAKRLRQHTESLKISLIAIEHQLRQLATRYGLTNFGVMSEPQRDEGQLVPLQVTFNGHIEKAMLMLAEIERRFPFLPVYGVKIANGPVVNKTEFKFALKYRYELIEPQRPVEREHAL